MKKKNLIIIVESVMYAIVTLISIVFMEQLVKLYIYGADITYFNTELDALISMKWGDSGPWLTFIIMLSIAFVFITMIFIMLLKLTIGKKHIKTLDAEIETK